MPISEQLRTESPYFVRLDAGATEPVGKIGGKAHNLARLVRWELPVPRAAAITTRAYTDATTGSPEVAQLTNAAGRLTFDSISINDLAKEAARVVAVDSQTTDPRLAPHS